MGRERRRRGPSRRDREREEYYEEDYGVVQRRSPNNGLWIGLAVALGVMFVAGLMFFLVLTPSRAPVSVYESQRDSRSLGANAPKEELRPVKMKDPKIDLKSVEQALWKTRTDNPKDFKAWMKKFEDEVNAIYFATLKRQNPKADPTTLLPKPVRVASQRVNKLLHLYGYIDNNNEQGFQQGKDTLLFAFKQTRPYEKGQQRLSYSLYDSSGYYYREPGYAHVVPIAMNPFFLGFFLYPTWHAMWWRSSFAWYHSPMWWSTGLFYSRYSYYYGMYPGYMGYYRTSYYARYRPWGWSRGTYYRRVGGRYYHRSSRYRSGYRGRTGYRSGYRGRTGYRSGYRGSGGRSGYRGSGGRSGYRGSGGRSGYRSRGGYGSGYRSRGGSGYRGGGGKW